MAVVTDVRSKLRDLPAMMECAKEVLEWLEEVDDAEDAMELFDIMECLGDVLSEGTESADDFVANTVAEA